MGISEDGNQLCLQQSIKRQWRSSWACPVFAHCEDKFLVADGVINEGEKSKLGLAGISNAVEDIIG